MPPPASPTSGNKERFVFLNITFPIKLLFRVPRTKAEIFASFHQGKEDIKIIT